MGALLGKSLAQFRIVQKLGEGGMGVVYEAVDEKLGRAVALKVLPDSVAEDPHRRARFLREARSAAAVTHPNIATIYEIGEAEGQIFIAMELVRGRALREVLSAPVTVPEALRLAREVALGLGRAHEERIVHRDLKPENVMVTSRGEVKILDFGLAKLFDAEAGPTSALAQAETEPALTQEGNVVGTPGYMSPEQARGEPVDARCDVFALGVMLYEMLGTRPFRGETALAILYATATKEPEPIEKLNPAVSPEVARLIARCLEKTPDARYQNGQALADALSALSSKVWRVPSFGSQPTQAALGSLASNAAHVLSFGSQPTEAALAVQPPKRDKRRPRWMIPIGVAAAGLLGVGAFALRSRTAPALVPSAEAPPATAASASAPRERGVRAITDLPLPTSTNLEAMAAYKRGMQLMRDSAYRGAQEEFESAIRLDGSLAGAHLRSALLGFGASLQFVQPRQREHFKAAVAGRSAMPEHDRLLLDAMEPAFRQPRRLVESERRLGALLTQTPDDVDYLFWRAFLLYATGSIDEALTLLNQAVAIDPSYCLAWSRYGDITDGASDQTEAAYHAYDACIAACPNGTRCLRSRIILAANDGDCERVDQDAHALVSLEAEDPYWQKWLARALYARGASVDAVRVVNQRVETLTAEPERRSTVLWDGIALDELAGDFTSAREKLRAIHALLEHEMREAPHLEEADEATQIEFEVSSVKSSAAAEEYLRHVDAWTLEGWGYDEGRLLMSSAARAAGALSLSEFTEQRDAWLKKAKGMEGWNSHGKMLWYAGFGYFLEPSGSAEALANLPTYHPDRGPGDRGPREDLALGKVYLFDGREDEATAPLKRAAKSCRALQFPIAHTQAHYWLGQALERKGEKAGACTAYRVVLERWGHAKPRSTTAEKARERVKEIGCRL